MTDALGRRRSSRNTATGPGSRGGLWDDPVYRAGYHAGWRRGNPDYSARETERVAARRLRASLARDRQNVERLALRESYPDDAVVKWFVRWLRARMTERAVSGSELREFTGIATSTVSRLLRDRRHPDPKFKWVAALVGAFGYRIEFVPVDDNGRSERTFGLADPADIGLASPIVPPPA